MRYGCSNLRERAALAVACVVTTMVWTTSADSRGWNWHLWQPVGESGYWIGTEQGPPPPITPQTWRLFVTLVSTYEKIGSNIPVSFAEWIVMNGISDPRDQWCLMWLWWNLTHQQAAD